MDLILEQLPQQLVNGITIGGVYALIALGYTMVYGILFMLNFAHGEVYMIGGFTGWWVLHLLTTSHGPVVNGFVVIVLMILVAMALTGCLGMAIERLAYRPLRKAPRMNLLLSALGVSIVLQNLVLRFQGAEVRFFKTSALIPDWLRIFEVGGAVISFMRLLVILVSLALMGALTWFVKSTKMGKAMRATAQDTEAATFMGINTNRIILLTFLIGSALGGAAGTLVGLLFTQVDYYVGYAAGLKGFTAAVLGGIGNIPGAMLGGFILGIVESLGTTLISSTYKDIIAFIVLILVLIIRPWGIMGEREPEKV
ncbi:MAG: branched-chain amino acid ABC transporter permease [Deltaproteobacteria bacterium]|nr:branched-chain amino acid ABC transporter permease [Deltaproteobacteria bacterium]MBW2137463.1 branched-chain amino acid ABC transporter permease [Deltaproteobacteria bacterium]